MTFFFCEAALNRCLCFKNKNAYLYGGCVQTGWVSGTGLFVRVVWCELMGVFGIHMLGLLPSTREQ